MTYLFFLNSCQGGKSIIARHLELFFPDVRIPRPCTIGRHFFLLENSSKVNIRSVLFCGLSTYLVDLRLPPSSQAISNSQVRPLSTDLVPRKESWCGIVWLKILDFLGPFNGIERIKSYFPRDDCDYCRERTTPEFPQKRSLSTTDSTQAEPLHCPGCRLIKVYYTCRRPGDFNFGYPVNLQIGYGNLSPGSHYHKEIPVLPAGWKWFIDPQNRFLYVDKYAGIGEKACFWHPPVMEKYPSEPVPRGWSRVESIFSRIHWRHDDSGLISYDHPRKSILSPGKMKAPFGSLQKGSLSTYLGKTAGKS